NEQTRATIAPSLVELWRGIESTGSNVVAIADTPFWGVRPEQCLARDPNCTIPYKSLKGHDRIVEAHNLYPDVPLIDFHDVICPADQCPAVVGNVFVWRDTDHLTALYSRTMADVFGNRLDVAILDN
ncbi:MAG: SGNH hydrolase domain-containing protein, partial [Mesorhizobium sp.]